MNIRMESYALNEDNVDEDAFMSHTIHNDPEETKQRLQVQNADNDTKFKWVLNKKAEGNKFFASNNFILAAHKYKSAIVVAKSLLSIKSESLA